MDKIDKIKENIGVTKLDEKTRKELFEKFVEGGGKVVNEKNRKLRLNANKEKQKNEKKGPKRYPYSDLKNEAPKVRKIKAVSPIRPVPSDDFVSLMNFFSGL